MDHWSAQLPKLVEAYLEFRSRDSGDGFPTVDDNDQATACSSGSIHDVDLVDIFCESPQSCRLWQYFYFIVKVDARQHWLLANTIFSPMRTLSIMDIWDVRQSLLLLLSQFVRLTLSGSFIESVRASAFRHSVNHCVNYTT